jgi:hypothetical protein
VPPKKTSLNTHLETLIPGGMGPQKGRSLEDGDILGSVEADLVQKIPEIERGSRIVAGSSHKIHPKLVSFGFEFA